MNLAISGGLRARNGTPFPFPRPSLGINGLDRHDNRVPNSPESPRDDSPVASTTHPARSSETAENTAALGPRLAPCRVDYPLSTRSRLQDAVPGIILHMQLERSTASDTEKVPCLSVKLASVPTLHVLVDKFWDNCFDLLDPDECFQRIEVKVDNESGTVQGVRTDFSIRMHGRSPDKRQHQLGCFAERSATSLQEQWNRCRVRFGSDCGSDAYRLRCMCARLARWSLSVNGFCCVHFSVQLVKYRQFNIYHRIA